MTNILPKVVDLFDKVFTTSDRRIMEGVYKELLLSTTEEYTYFLKLVVDMEKPEALDAWIADCPLPEEVFLDCVHLLCSFVVLCLFPLPLSSLLSTSSCCVAVSPFGEANSSWLPRHASSQRPRTLIRRTSNTSKISRSMGPTIQSPACKWG